jgi:hypothetical protein
MWVPTYQINYRSFCSLFTPNPKCSGQLYMSEPSGALCQYRITRQECIPTLSRFFHKKGMLRRHEHKDDTTQLTNAPPTQPEYSMQNSEQYLICLCPLPPHGGRGDLPETVIKTLSKCIWSSELRTRAGPKLRKSVAVS